MQNYTFWAGSDYHRIVNQPAVSILWTAMPVPRGGLRSGNPHVDEVFLQLRAANRVLLFHRLWVLRVLKVFKNRSSGHSSMYGFGRTVFSWVRFRLRTTSEKLRAKVLRALKCPREQPMVFADRPEIRSGRPVAACCIIEPAAR